MADPEAAAAAYTTAGYAGQEQAEAPPGDDPGDGSLAGTLLVPGDHDRWEYAEVVIPRRSLTGPVGTAVAVRLYETPDSWVDVDADTSPGGPD